jgi:hypothetical protein
MEVQIDRERKAANSLIEEERDTWERRFEELEL